MIRRGISVLKIMKGIALALTLCFALQLVGYADSASNEIIVEQKNVNSETGIAVISGVTDASGQIMLTVLKKDRTYEDVDRKTTQAEKLTEMVYLGQTNIKNGAFTFNFAFDLSNVSGDYKFKLRTNDAETTGILEFYKLSDVDVKLSLAEEVRKKVVDDINITKNTKMTEMKDMLTDYTNQKILALNGEFYTGKTITELDDSVFFAIANGTDVINKKEKLKDLIDEYHMIYVLKSAANVEEFGVCIDDCKATLGWDDNKAFVKLYKDDIRKAALANVYKDRIKLTRAADTLEALSKQTMLCAVNSCENWELIRNVYDACKTEWELTGEPTDTDLLNTSAGIPYMTLENFLSALQGEMNLPDGQGGNGGTNNGSGGGSGGSGRSSDSARGYLPMVSTITKNDTKSDELKSEAKGSTIAGFTDLGQHKWAATAIEELKKKGIINGKTESVFEPEATVTREEFVKMIVCMLKLDLDEVPTAFGDVDANSWYAPYVYAAYKNGIVSGVSDTEFGVGQPIIRQDMALMIKNALGKKISSSNETNKFADYETVSDYAKASINAMQSAGIINGVGDNTFAPHKSSNRAEAAQIIYNALKFVD